MSEESPPPVPRLRLGMALANLRAEARIDGKTAAQQIGVSTSQLSKIENGNASIDLDQLRALFKLYRVDEDDRARLEDMANATGRAAWWDRYDDVLPEDLETYVGLEQGANRLDAFVGSLVHALFQTEDYARAGITALLPEHGPASVDRMVRLRMDRQEVLSREQYPVHVIIDEMALHRWVGGPTVMRDQLTHLCDVATAPNITLQIIPLKAGAHPGQEGPFTILTFTANTSREQDWSIVYIGSSAGNIYFTKPKVVLPYVDRWTRLEQVAASPEESIKLLETIKKEYT